MRKLQLATALVVAGLAAATTAIADSNPGDDNAITLAVFGDWPYNNILLNTASVLVDSINADPDVSLVMHVGDIHSGSQACTSAGILPPIPNSNPGWNQAVYYQFQQFNAPMIYTPGDNEWADCHKSKQFASGQPLKELQSVRNLFFARAGHSLGRMDKLVWSQAQHFDPAYPSDAKYVENVMWHDHGVAFVTLNMPGGSNNDTAAWTNGFEDAPAHIAEVAERTAADIRWLETAFQQAASGQTKAMVVVLQADVWDPAAAAPGGAGLDQYTPFVQRLADLSVAFGRPVLVINGDTHLVESDRPLADPTSATGVIHHTQAVPNLQRFVVQGAASSEAGSSPAVWLRLTIDARKKDVFNFVPVTYCGNPTVACP